MVAVDTSSWIAFLAGEPGGDTVEIRRALKARQAVLPPPVLAEVLGARNLTNELQEFFEDLPLLEVAEGYWKRAGVLRARLVSQGFRARLPDVLIAQSCLDHDLPLITRDRDFRHFRSVGLKLISEIQ